MNDPDGLEGEFALVRIAQAICELRRVRRDEFGLAIDEAAWDMLIELYFRESSGASTTAADLQDAARLPALVANRWVRHLENEGFIRSVAHPIDDQTAFVELTSMAREALERYLTEVRAVAARQVPAR